MGDSSGSEISVIGTELESFSVETPGGRHHIRWDSEARATPNAQLAFFAEFLATAGIYENWIDCCPLRYSSSSGGDQDKRDALGIWFLSILAAHHRYSHITALRGDGVSPQILGMSKIVSEDALRRALARMSASESQDWLQPQLLSSVRAALDTPWILDIDSTVKTLFGQQGGAEVSYNPHKPGRPSHALHTYYAGGLRLVLDVGVCGAGDQQRLSTGVDGAVISRPGRCGKRLRRVEKPMGLGRLHYPGHRTLPDQRPRRGAALQLVELVLPRRKAGSAHGGHHQQSIAVGGSGQSDPAGGADDAPPDANARRQNRIDDVDR